MAGVRPIRPERTIRLSNRDFDLVRRGMLDRLHEGLERTMGLADELRQKGGDIDEGALAADLRGSIKILRDELNALEALGWHDDHYREERGTG